MNPEDIDGRLYAGRQIERTYYDHTKSMAYRRRGRADADRLWRRVRVERLPHSVVASSRLDHRRSHGRVRDRYLRRRAGGIRRRTVDETEPDRAPVAIAAAVLYGLGTMLTGTAHDLTTLYLTYGLIGGAGLGLGYIVPIATLVRWFPDKRGMITGLAVAGFGAGALVTAPVANSLIASVGVGRTFEVLGLAYLVVVLACALVMRNPPEGYRAGGIPRRGLRSPAERLRRISHSGRRSEPGSGTRCGLHCS